jgi:hypothetical protein
MSNENEFTEYGETIIPLSDSDLKRLSVILNLSEDGMIWDEEKFAESTDCPPENLESWLQAAWVQYDILSVLEGTETVGADPWLLAKPCDDGVAIRLFCPKEERRLQVAQEDHSASLRKAIAERPWRESANLLVRDILAFANACATRRLTLEETRVFMCALETSIPTLLELRDAPYEEEVAHLEAAIREVCQAIEVRDVASPQSLNAEAKVNSRYLEDVDRDPVLDSFPSFVELIRKTCSEQTAQYMSDDLLLEPDQFLDMLHMLAHDDAEPFDIPNPAARIRAALSRNQRRRQLLDRKRSMTITPEQTKALEDSAQVESSAIAKIDWERGRKVVDLPADQTWAVEAKLEGLSLQSSEAPHYLGWDPTRLAAVRRSLEPDRRWGKKLREYFRAYNAEKIAPEKRLDAKKLS